MSDQKPPNPPLPPGWYPNPAMGGVLQLWDGSKWTENFAPPTPVKGQRFSTGAGLVIAGLIFLALLGGWLIYQSVKGPSDLDCSLQRVEYDQGTRSLSDVDEECRR